MKQTCRNRRCTKELILKVKKIGYKSRTSDEGKVTLSEAEDDLGIMTQERGTEGARRNGYKRERRKSSEQQQEEKVPGREGWEGIRERYTQGTAQTPTRKKVKRQRP